MSRTTTLIALLIAAPLMAQNSAPVKPAHLQGQIVDTLGHPIRAAIVETDDPPKATVSDDDGFFKFAELPPGPITIRVRHLGYTGIDFQLRLMADSTLSIGVKLLGAAQMLAPVEVDAGAAARHPQLAQTGFYNRMRVGWGHMVTPEEIDKRRSSVPGASSFLQDIVGVQVKHAAARGRGGAGGAVIYGKNPTGGDCVMNLVFNGSPVTLRNGDTFDNFISATDVYAIEVYSRATEIPQEYQQLLGTNFCGAIVVWTASKMTLKPQQKN